MFSLVFATFRSNRLYLRRLHESFRPRKKSSRDELISVAGNFLAAVYMALGRNELIQGWTHLSTW